MQYQETPPQSAPQPGMPAGKPKTSGWAIASLIFSLVGPCTFGITALIGAILGFVALGRIKKSGGVVGGKGLAIAGIIIGLLVVVLMVLLLAGGYMGARWGKSKAEEVQAMAHGNSLGTAAQIYAQENDGNMPGRNWQEQLQDTQDVGDPMSSWGREGKARFAMNQNLAGKKRAELGDTEKLVLFFECKPGTGPLGGPGDLADEPVGSSPVVVFADGSVKTVATAGRDLTWTISR
ncbi:MAG: DUF4190 domain-containing protein [Phycisphaerae bacterium]